TRLCKAAGTSFAVASKPISIRIRFTWDGRPGPSMPPEDGADARRLIHRKKRNSKIGSSALPPNPKNGKNSGNGIPPPPKPPPPPPRRPPPPAPPPPPTTPPPPPVATAEAATTADAAARGQGGHREFENQDSRDRGRQEPALRFRHHRLQLKEPRGLDEFRPSVVAIPTARPARAGGASRPRRGAAV